jgi:hypothetical protein
MAWQSTSAALVPSNLCGSMYVLNRCYLFTNLHEKVINDIETNMVGHPFRCPHDYNIKMGLFCSGVFLGDQLYEN